MTFNLKTAGIRGILLDIEGTTTPIQFVYETLFPYVRNQLQAFLKTHADEARVLEIVRALKLERDDDLRANLSPPNWQDLPVDYVLWLMDQDRKSTALKVLQGIIWFDGYQSGHLHGVVFPDVPPALDRWHRQGIDVRIFSSGSELAQRLLFGSTADGDLTRLLKGYFDTTIGPKGEASSYVEIARKFQRPCSEILFISDVTRELDAAHTAGMQTFLCTRPGNQPQVMHGHKPVSTFDQIR